MSKPIAIFYHCLFALGNPPQLLPVALDIIQWQMSIVESVGLLDAASHFVVGVNGGMESEALAAITIPTKAEVVMHGLQARSEVPTMLMIEDWLPGHRDWNVLYFHAKGATHKPGDDYRTRWRNCMMRSLILEWRQCVSDLERGFDSVGCHWLDSRVYPQMPPKQAIWGGNFWWATSNFLSTLPSIRQRERIRTSGANAFESRYEAEVWIGNGPKLPRVRDYHPEWPT